MYAPIVADLTTQYPPIPSIKIIQWVRGVDGFQAILIPALGKEFVLLADAILDRGILPAIHLMLITAYVQDVMVVLHSLVIYWGAHVSVCFPTKEGGSCTGLITPCADKM